MSTFSIIFTIVWGLISLVIGWFLNDYFDHLKKNKIAKQIKEENKKLANSLIEIIDSNVFDNVDGILELSHGIPTFSKSLVDLSTDDSSFYYPIPEDKKERLAQLKFKQENNDFTLSDDMNLLSSSCRANTLKRVNEGIQFFNGKDLNEIKNELRDIANEVADNFVQKLNCGLVRFNGALFGVSAFRGNRLAGIEYPTIDFSFYKTDYFTFRVFARYYELHRDEFLKNHQNTSHSVIINKLSYPFLSSFGVACFVILSFNDEMTKLAEDDILLLGKRSREVEVDQGKLHFTMNEAFSLRDCLNDGKPDYERCLDRGLEEEIGQIPDYAEGSTKTIRNLSGTRFGDYKFISVLFDSNKCEMGICCYVKVVLDRNTISVNEYVNKFLACYRAAKDSHLETTGIETLRVGDIQSFLDSCGTEKDENNEYILSRGAKAALQMIEERYRLHII